MYAQAAIINPSFLRLAINAGFKVPKDFGEKVLDKLFNRTEWSPEARVAVLEVGYPFAAMVHPILTTGQELYD